MKICLAGTGAMGEIHMKALQKLDDVHVISVNSRTDDGGKAFAEKWKIPFQSTSLEECIDRPGVDAVILTTPSSMHPDQTILALNKGKHVQVEIPMSLNLPDARRMLEVARKTGKVCMVTHTRRFSSPHRWRYFFHPSESLEARRPNGFMSFGMGKSIRNGNQCWCRMAGRRPTAFQSAGEVHRRRDTACFFGNQMPGR